MVTTVSRFSWPTLVSGGKSTLKEKEMVAGMDCLETKKQKITV